MACNTNTDIHNARGDKIQIHGGGESLEGMIPYWPTLFPQPFWHRPMPFIFTIPVKKNRHLVSSAAGGLAIDKQSPEQGE